ncbi:cysteine proteinase [Lepidopterella palustris CBS 459.81]|uniref:Cysteine proteinase n=1 Tax=Lepidopterella palustris CBS 459.81 TaxID=1314670 RepID=A0A8E2E6F5_9PEZI|nr:cysteine proteinase [Lepidopterella palustris CBS 459.81]
MATIQSQVSALKSEANELQSRIDDAPTQKEALNFAITAGELFMKALRLCTDKNEKIDLRAQCKLLLERAEQIHAAVQWPPRPAVTSPEANVSQPQSGFHDIDRWTKAVGGSPEPEYPFMDEKDRSISYTSSASELTLIDLAIDHNQVRSPSLSSNDEASKPLTSVAAQSVISRYSKSSSIPSTRSKESAFDSLIDFYKSRPESPRPPTKIDTPAIVPTHIVSTPICSPKAIVEPTTQLTPKQDVTITDTYWRATDSPATPKPLVTERRTQIRNLVEPISTRKLPKKEEILLLKSSKVNGFTFAPWNAPPKSSDFMLPNGADSFLDIPALDISAHQLQFFDGWVRAKEALPPPTWFPNGRGDMGPVMSVDCSIDLVQDATTDCSVVASLCAGIARSERGHVKMLSNKIWPYDRVKDTPVISPNGKYIIRLNFNGCWRKVIIDDRLPLSKTNRMLHVVDRRNPALLWPALLEKAYLKVRGGYDFPGSNSCSDLWALTGWIPEQIYLQEGELVPNHVWKRVYNAFLYGDVLVTLGTGKMTHRNERELGLEGQHCYAVLDMKETDHERVLLVKNPWVDGKGWRGKQPSAVSTLDTSSSGGASSRGEYPMQNAPPSPNKLRPGTFWIGLDSVVQHFESLYLNWNPGLFTYRQDLHFQWDLTSPVDQCGCIVDHPQFSFTSTGGGTVWFLLCRHFRDAPPGVHEQSDAFNDGTVRSDMELYSVGAPPKGYMSIYVYDRKGEQVYVQDNHLERGPYVDTPQSLLRWECPPSSSYTLTMAQDELPASLYTFTLSAFSNSNINLEPARQKYPYRAQVSGSWTKETAGGDINSSKYFSNPQFCLKVTERTQLAMLIRTTTGNSPLHVKLVHGRGKRVYSLQSRDILVDSGGHRHRCALAEVEDVPPGTYTIICSMFEPGKTADFSLRVDSTTNCVLTSIPRDGAGLVSMRLSNACFGPVVNKIAAPLVPKRLAGVVIVARFIRARSTRLPNEPQNEIKTRSPLRLTVEMGRGPERLFLMSSENGEYSDAEAVRTQSVDLSPNMLYSGDLWIVLDRIATPGTSIEEWYEVELFADCPNACSVGVWRAWDD